jgi:hypothetical protein
LAVPRRPALSLVFLLGVTAAIAACSGSNETVTDTSVAPAPSSSVTTTSNASSGDTAPPSNSHVVRFDAPAEVACQAGTATVRITYETIDLAAVTFIVDGQPVAGGRAAPTSGDYSVEVACDGNVHTVMLVGTGPSGPAFATRAVATRPT